MQFWVIIVVPSLHLVYGTEKGPGVSKLVDQSLCVKYNPCLCKAQCLRYSHELLVSLSCRPFLFYCCCSLKFVLKILLFPFCSSFLPQASFPQCLLVYTLDTYSIPLWCFKSYRDSIMWMPIKVAIVCLLRLI